MERIPVKSSNLKSVGYDKLTQTLEIEFLKDTIYEYSRVPLDEYIELMQTEKKGEYFSSRIRDNRLYGCSQTYPKYKWLRQ